VENSLKSLLSTVTGLELSIESEPSRRINMKCEVVEVPTDTQIAVSMPIYNGRRVPLDLGIVVTVHFIAPEIGACKYRGEVIRRVMDPLSPLLIIEQRSPVEKNQRRNYYRMPVVMGVTLQLPNGTTKEKVVNNGKVEEIEILSFRNINIVTKDISGGGLRAVVSELIKQGTNVRVLIPLERDELELEAEIIRCEIIPDVIIRYDLGIQFGNIDEKTRNRIIAFIFDKQRNLMKKGLI